MNVKLHFLQHIVQHVSTEVQQARLQAIPTSTKKDTAWCFNIWRDWSVANSTDAYNISQDITTLCPEKLMRYISRFILEVRKKDGTEYPPNTLYHIICGLMRHLRQNGMPDVDFFKEKAYADLRTTLDAEIKRLKLLGIGATKRQADVLTEDEEELLWREGVLGYHSPKSLLNTVFFFNGVCFALRSGEEHRQLRWRNRSQIQLFEKKDKEQAWCTKRIPLKTIKEE